MINMRSDMPLKLVVRAVAALLFISIFSSPVVAGDFRIQPTSLDVLSNEKSGAFSVINNGDQKLNFQISVMEWSQDASGKDVYTDTKDVVFFPKIMTVEPGEQRAIRIGFKDAPSQKEKTYRIFIKEIPLQKKPAEGKITGKTSAGLTILFEYAIPIFLKPARIQENGSIDKTEMSKGVVKTVVSNTGNVHIRLNSVKFKGKAADGRELFSQDVAGWYILQGGSRSYEVSVPKEICGNLASIEIKAQSENFVINGSLNVEKKMCTQ